MTRARRIRVAALVALVAALVAVAGGAWLALGSRAHPAAGGSPGSPLFADSPALWYSAETAREVLLLAAPLDGSAPPRVAATRPSGPGDTARAWHVGPTGDVVVWAHGDVEAGTAVIEGVDLRTGRTAWRQDVEGYPEHGVWSADGRHWAATLGGRDGEQPGYVVVDATTGATTQAAMVAGAVPIGLTADGNVVLGERLANETGWDAGWRFHRLVRATGGAEPLPAEDLRDATLSGPDLRISARHLTEARTVQVPDGQADRIVRVQLVDLVTGEGRYVGPEDASDVRSVSFTPDGSRLLLDIAVEEGGDGTSSIVVLDLDGAGGEVARGPLRSERIFSPDGQYAATASWLEGPVISAFDLDAGRSADVPLPDGLVAAAPRAIRGGGDVPVLAIAEPAATPSPPATPSPLATPAPSVVPGGPVFAAPRIEEAAPGDRLGHVALLAPAQGGGAAVIASLEPMELAAEETISAQPFPDSEDWLISVGASPGLRLWRWAPGERAVGLELPPDLADAGAHVALHPDGGSLAILFYSAAGPTMLALVDLEGGAHRSIALEPPYTELAGWAADGERIVLGHHVCTEGCKGRYAFYAWLDPASGDVTPFGPADRDGRIPVWHASPDAERRVLLLSSIQDETADDIVLEWPDGEPIPDLRHQGWSPDVADLYLETVEGDVSTLVVIRDAAANGPGRHQVSPERIGALPAGLTVHALHPGERWVLAVDRANATYLVDLEVGTAEPFGAGLATGDVRWDEGD